MMRKNYFKIYVRIMEEKTPFYVSDGYICIENGVFEGYMTDDYITGNIEENILYIETLMHNYEDECDEYAIFSQKVDFFEIPGMYTTRDSITELELEISFREKITSVSKIEQITHILKKIKRFYEIPDTAQ